MDELLAAIEQLTQKVDMLQASLAATQFKLAYTTKELAEALGTYPQRIHVLREARTAYWHAKRARVDIHSRGSRKISQAYPRHGLEQ